MYHNVHYVLQSIRMRVRYVFQPIDISTTNFTEIFFQKRLHTGS